MSAGSQLPWVPLLPKSWLVTGTAEWEQQPVVGEKQPVRVDSIENSPLFVTTVVTSFSYEFVEVGELDLQCASANVYRGVRASHRLII